MINKVDHIGVAVRSISQVLPFYERTLGLKLEGIESVEEQKVKVAFLKIGNTKIELLEPTSDESPVAKFIEKRGEGIHHLALGVDDIKKRIEELKENGIKMIDETPRNGAGGASIAFLHPKAANGVLVELCEKRGTVL
ncbi:methylmalonyl-CoA epimerase [Metabacillus idriensis]|uniref:methylmalonyl-CoA epimerase n=1 Tax=Metabacillus idriensis TaxID=324768 RepID=UPI00163A43D0|nr:methylmalonyl-CoA epimerase [Metabacillus idriensis]QNG61306.1 methylmalonyl-CoA epimerase [Bacillus sp. PAMC26568]